ncbi:MAG TPA: symmetrical bis(5'-nucleosyl)-tetraphosphatase [Thermoanaerobaculia bacterium]|nr:symmetrical bis(5'-nucleosyl)-tetraphosphatase [Thermoanaerobaculia bacterium]
MATYAIGDVHGCYDTLQRLLRRIQYDRREDRLWLVGDLVNRGPRSLGVLRWAVEEEDRIVVVLGNHDLHFLGRGWGVSPEKRRDTLGQLLAAPDRDDLLEWLRRRPLFHREDGYALVHAGLFPAWTVEKAERLAREVEERLRGDGAAELVGAVDKKTAERWRSGLEGLERARTALAAFSRLRTIDPEGRMCAEFSGPPREAPKGCTAWYAAPGRKSADVRLVFGHWAALGLWRKDGVVCLDTGCAWGRELTALRLDDGRVFQERSSEG